MNLGSGMEVFSLSKSASHSIKIPIRRYPVPFASGL